MKKITGILTIYDKEEYQNFKDNGDGTLDVYHYINKHNGHFIGTLDIQDMPQDNKKITDLESHIIRLQTQLDHMSQAIDQIHGYQEIRDFQIDKAYLLSRITRLTSDDQTHVYNLISVLENLKSESAEYISTYIITDKYISNTEKSK